MNRVPSETHIFVRALGIIAIDVGERRIGPSSGRLFALLLYLACRRGQPTSRRAVQELLFPEATNGHTLGDLICRRGKLAPYNHRPIPKDEAR